MYLAPEDGYVEGFDFSHDGNQLRQRRGFTKRFYLKTRAGKVWGRMSLDLYAMYNSKIPARLEIKYAINPNGSRFLGP